MKRTLFIASAIASVAVIDLSDHLLLAQNPRVPQQIETRKVSPSAMMTPITLRASTLTGMKVKNAANKDLGTINDFVVTMPEGKIRYLAVAYGGFLGVGNKLFAIPATAFDVQRDSGSNSLYLVLDLPEERLKNAPGFDQSNWPDFASAKWQQEVDTYYHSGKAVNGVNIDIHVPPTSGVK